MELLTIISTHEALSLLGLTLVVTAVYLRMKQLHNNRFAYFTATLLTPHIDVGGMFKEYGKVARGKVLRKNKKSRQWEIHHPLHGWKPLTQGKVNMVEKMVSEGVPIKIDID
jgi:hypothetical protein